MVDGDLLPALEDMFLDVLAIIAEWTVLDPRVLSAVVFNRSGVVRLSDRVGRAAETISCLAHTLGITEKNFYKLLFDIPVILSSGVGSGKWLALPSKSGGKPAICRASLILKLNAGGICLPRQ
ncbi:MAG: hypothetical protein M9896_17765 [Candidatus Promineofilum sp.]|uniref:hypothetical protein n=1 Tax=Promineifilum sp. TaxID=2664178 RepID=UPI002411DBC5|nr:hypothetical protein [Promineifilum sp.]